MVYEKASDIKITQPIFIIDQVMNLKESMEENQINTFLCNADSRSKSDLSSLPMNQILNAEIQETNDPATLSSLYSILKTNL